MKKKEIKVTLKMAIGISITIVVVAIALYFVINIVVSSSNESNPNKVNNNSQQSILNVEHDPLQGMTDYKPIIYLYPKQETNVSVKLLKKDSITCSYPKYKGGWDVIAEPNGDLEEIGTGKKLYSLYYENTNNIEFKVQKDGYIVKREDVEDFLEEKLEILGLNYKEKEEFIIYWLPKLESNKYNYIRFATQEEINENMPLEINPKPDTIIRVLMTYKGLQEPIEVEEQKLVTPERKGFVAVEWGGTEM